MRLGEPHFPAAPAAPELMWDHSSFPGAVLGPSPTLPGGGEEGKQALNYARKLYITRKIIYLFIYFISTMNSNYLHLLKIILNKKNRSLGTPGKINGPRLFSLVFFKSRCRAGRQGAATAVCLLVPVRAPQISLSLSSLQWLSLQGLGGFAVPGLGALCGEVSSTGTAMAGHCGGERAGTPRDCPGLRAELSSAPRSSLVFMLHSNPVGPRLHPRCPGGFLAVRDPTALHGIFFGDLPWGFGGVKTS